MISDTENHRWEYRGITTNGILKHHWFWYCQEHWNVDPVGGGPWTISEKQPEIPPNICDACECILFERSLRAQANMNPIRLGLNQIFLTLDQEEK
jgi:hypothetical protein